MKYNKIALIGMMGSGKTTISKELANVLKFNLFDIDSIFENEEKISINDFFKKYGEEEFRKKENILLKKISKEDKTIISCGGGIILNKENQDILFNNDIFTIYLKAQSETIFERIKYDTSRPLLNVKNPKKEIEKILSKRENLYKKAHLTITTDDKKIEEITEEITKYLWKN